MYGASNEYFLIHGKFRNIKVNAFGKIKL